jgi:hypothetical protein
MAALKYIKQRGGKMDSIESFMTGGAPKARVTQKGGSCGMTGGAPKARVTQKGGTYQQSPFTVPMASSQINETPALWMKGGWTSPRPSLRK